MRYVTPAEYQSLLQNSKILEQDKYGPKVLLTQEQLIVKLFRRKRFFSKMLLFSAGKRFAANARLLKNRQIDTITVTDYGRCSEPPRDMVWYEYLEGIPLREVCLTASPDQLPSLVERLGAFIATLHQRGVLFRSLHWNNILVQPSGRFALIDILDLGVQQIPLMNFQRQRNFNHLFCRHQHDLKIYQAHKEAFWAGYGAKTRLSSQQLNRLKQLSFSSRK